MRGPPTKPTMIYGLIDPRNQQLRYIGKTVLDPIKRLSTHLALAGKGLHKRHSMAWLVGLKAANFIPEIVILETIKPGSDWVEAEQFWIGYFRMIGADLCNHSAGGEGMTGYKQPPEMIEKRIRRGSANHSFGKPQPAHVHAALRAGSKRFNADPVKKALAERNRKAAMTPEKMRNSIAGLKRAHADPKIHARSIARTIVKANMPEARALVSKQSRERWQIMRQEIIDAQNIGKDEEWRNKQRIAKRQQWSVPGNKMAIAMAIRRKLSDGAVTEIRLRAINGENQQGLANEFGVAQSTISYIKLGCRRYKM